MLIQCTIFLRLFHVSKDLQASICVYKCSVHSSGLFYIKLLGTLAPYLYTECNDCDFSSLQLNIPEEKVHRRNTLEIIRSSTKERGKSVRDNRHSWVRIESRYKLIIDPSEDQSLVRLLFSYNILPEGKTRVYICSDFPSDQQSEVCFPLIIPYVCLYCNQLSLQKHKYHSHNSP